MKHSSSSSMSESCEAKVTVPCIGNWDSVLKNLYVDLFNLIVESRIPGKNERGYGDGSHCPPLLGPNMHFCDLSKPECQKHQRLIYHLLQAVRQNVFEIEVLMLPDCCSESKLSERIQSKEYILLERWSMKCIYGKSQSAIEVSELLRAVRSFLHFSQISAWLSLTKGKSPSNIYYWVKPTDDPSSTQFQSTPEVHSFPICKINDDVSGIVKVNFPTRKQYVPIIPCSKHPPLCELAFKTIKDDSNLKTQNIPLNTQIVKQLQKTCDKEQKIITVKHCAADPEPLSVLKTVTHNLDVNKGNKLFKHSKSPLMSQNALNSVSKCASQENLCLSKKSRNAQLSRIEPTLNIINNVLLPSVCESSHLDITHQYLPEQTVTNCLEVPSKLSNSELCVISDSNFLLQTVDTSQTVPNILYDESLLNTQQKCQTSLKSLKRKQNEGLKNHIIPRKKRKNVLNIKDQLLTSYPVESYSCQENTRKKYRKKKHSLIGINKSAKLVSKKVKSDDNLNSGISNEFNIDQNTAHYMSNISPSNILENIATTKLFASHEYHQPLNLEEKLMQCRIPNVETIYSYENDNSFNYYANNNCTNKIFDKNVYLKNAFDYSDCNFELLSKETEKISDFKCEQNHFINMNFLESDMFKSSEWEKNLYCTNTSMPYFNCNQLQKSQNKNYNIIDKNTSQRKFADNSQTEKMVLENYIPYQENIFNLLDSCNKSLASSEDNLFKKSSTLMSSQRKQFKLKKHFSKSFYKCKTSTHLENLKLCDNDVNKIFSLCFPSSVKSINMSSSDKVSTELHKCSNKDPKYLTNKSSKNICNKTLSKNKHKKTNTSNFVLNNARQSAINETNAHASKETKVWTDGQLIKYNKTIVCTPSHKSLYFKTSGCSQAMPCLEHKSQVNSKTGNLEKAMDASFLNPRKKFLKSIQGLLSHQKSNMNEPMVLSSSVLDIPNENSASSNKIRNLNNFCTILNQKTTRYLDCFPKFKLKFAKGRKLLGNFEESILKGCLPPVSNVKGFNVEIGASGSFCPNHITLPADVSFYELDSPHSGTTPYMAHVSLQDIEYCLPKKGAVQVTLFNPSETVVKMFVLNYDLSEMPPMCHTFIRQKTYYMPIGSTEECPSSQKWLRFIIHLRFASSKAGKISLHKDFKIVVLNKSNDDAASEFSQEPRELRSFLHVPMNPKFSNI